MKVLRVLRPRDPMASLSNSIYVAACVVLERGWLIYIFSRLPLRLHSHRLLRRSRLGCGVQRRVGRQVEGERRGLDHNKLGLPTAASLHPRTVRFREGERYLLGYRLVATPPTRRPAFSVSGVALSCESRNTFADASFASDRFELCGRPRGEDGVTTDRRINKRTAGVKPQHSAVLQSALTDGSHSCSH
jgi:hypothetical protein